MDVTVTQDGKLQLTTDGKVWAPLSIEAVQDLAEKIPEAQAVLMQVPLAEALREVTTALSSGNATATVVVEDDVITVTADPPTFADLAQALGVTAGPATSSITAGPVTVNKTTGA